MRLSILFRQIICIGFCFLVFPSFIDAQIIGIKDFKERKARADSIANALKDGVLVIRLKSYRNNLEAMDKSLASRRLSKKERKRLQKTRDMMVNDRDRFNNELVQAFDTLYDFSKFRIMYDTASHLLLSGVENGYFLNNQLELDPKISLEKQQPFAILGEGSRNKEGVHGLVVYDAEGEIVAAPFPSFFDFRNHRRGLLSLFRGNAYIRKSGDILARKINSKFKAFHRN